MRELSPERRSRWQEGLLILGIALVTSIVTLGVLDCLFDQVQCVQVRSDGSEDTLYSLKGCAPADLE